MSAMSSPRNRQGGNVFFCLWLIVGLSSFVLSHIGSDCKVFGGNWTQVRPQFSHFLVSLAWS
jgi:hypothetical protein